MREIIFRGKDSSGTINHSWQYGSLDTTVDGFPTIMFHDRFGNKCEINVSSNTIGQYTGITDKNGKRIFEGDILKADNGHIGFVTFCRGAFVKHCLCHPKNANSIYKNNEAIIGNRYDNPELLESGGCNDK